MQIAQLLSDTGRRLIRRSEHLFHVPVSRKNKNNIKHNSRPGIFCALTNNLTQSRHNRRLRIQRRKPFRGRYQQGA